MLFIYVEADMVGNSENMFKNGVRILLNDLYCRVVSNQAKSPTRFIKMYIFKIFKICFLNIF